MDILKAKLMKNKPTALELASPQPSKKTMIIFRAAMEQAAKEQNRLLKKAAKLSH